MAEGRGRMLRLYMCSADGEPADKGGVGVGGWGPLP
jgi:hypothetical protein